MSRDVPKTLEAKIPLVRIDDGARDGKYQFLTDGYNFALARWTDNGWAYPGGAGLYMTPTHYRPASKVIGAEDAA